MHRVLTRWTLLVAHYWTAVVNVVLLVSIVDDDKAVDWEDLEDVGTNVDVVVRERCRAVGIDMSV